MSTITASAAKTRFGELLDRVARGEEIVITRHDKPVARLISEGRRSQEIVRAAVTGLRDLQQAIAARARGKGRLSDAAVRSAMDEGRP